jgi:sortase A
MTVIPLFRLIYFREWMSWTLKLERLLQNAGVLLVVLFVIAVIHRVVLSRVELKEFKSQQAVFAAKLKQLAPSNSTPTFNSWSEQRIRDYQASLLARVAPAIGILRISKIRVEVPILEGTDSLSLNRGVGHIAGTANPGEEGNIAIAGHRDGFFRGLKDVSLGDAVEVASLHETDTYIVDRISIVDPSDVSVLEPRTHSSLTLVTCYPFHYIGSAPKRYIVQGSVIDPAFANSHARTKQGSTPAFVGPALVRR